MNDETTTIQSLKNNVDLFVKAHQWRKHHTGKNLSMAMVIEAVALMDHFQWIESANSKEEVDQHREDIEQQIADLVATILNFCSIYNIDISDAIHRRIDMQMKK